MPIVFIILGLDLYTVVFMHPVQSYQCVSLSLYAYYIMFSAMNNSHNNNNKLYDSRHILNMNRLDKIVLIISTQYHTNQTKW